MLKKYIILFVLVMLMVKTNAQSFYYFHGNKIPLKESDDKILIRLGDPTDMQAKSALEAKIKGDHDFDLVTSGANGLYIIKKRSGPLINKKEIIDAYMQRPEVAYVAPIYNEQPNGSFLGITQEVVAKLNPGVGAAVINDLARPYGLLSVLPNVHDERLFHLFFNKNNQLNTADIAAALYETGSFEYVQPAFMAAIKQNSYSSASCPASYTAPNDPYYTYQWNLYNPGGYYSFFPYARAYHGLPDPIAVAANEDIDICHAWNVTTGENKNVTVDGSNVRVAVIDGGVDIYQPDLVSSFIPAGTSIVGYDATGPFSSGGYTYTPDYCYYCNPGHAFMPPILNPGTPNWPDMHGTLCAGIITAARNNHSGLSGIAPGAKLIPVRASYLDGTLGVCPPYEVTFDTWEYNGIEWAGVPCNGCANADILSCSWSWVGFDNLIDNAINDVVTYGRNGDKKHGKTGNGCVVVFSAGNENNDTINWPSSHPRVISVGASTMCGERKRSSSNSMLVGHGVHTDPNDVSCDGEYWWGSNYGYGKGYYSSGSNDSNGVLSVLAPGVDIITTAFSADSIPHSWFDTYCTPQAGSYDTSFDGTSASAPHVAGVAALMLSQNPCLTYQDVKDIIERTADKINTPTYTYSYSMRNGSWDPQAGYGRLNAGNAVTLAHDIYKQNLTEPAITKVYRSPHQVYAGYHVTDAIDPGYYTLPTGSNITIYAPEAIYLEPGFVSTFSATSSVFLAQIDASPGCGNPTDYHYKSTPPNNHLAKVSGTAISNVNIYPNPVEDQLNVSFTLPQDETAIFTVTNVVGQQVLNSISGSFVSGSNKQVIPVASLMPGIYLLSIKTINATAQFKFVKE